MLDRNEVEKIFVSATNSREDIWNDLPAEMVEEVISQILQLRDKTIEQLKSKIKELERKIK